MSEKKSVMGAEDGARLVAAELALQKAAGEFVREDMAGAGGMPLIRAERALRAAAVKFTDELRRYTEEE
jgi:hypothetical protein